METNDSKNCVIKPVKVLEFNSYFEELLATLRDGESADKLFSASVLPGSRQHYCLPLQREFFGVTEALRYRDRVLARLEFEDYQVWYFLIAIEGDWKIYDISHKVVNPARLITDEELKAGLGKRVSSVLPDVME
jgi:hypothetical protein